MKINIIILVMFFTVLSSAQAGSLIGTTVPPFPEGLESKSGACISYELGNDRFCDYAVGLVRKIGQKPHSIIIEKQIGRKGNSSIWEVTDEIEMPIIKKDSHLSFSRCKLDDVYNPTVIAVVIYTEEEFHKASTWAGIIDLKNGLFSEIPTQNIECENEGWEI